MNIRQSLITLLLLSLTLTAQAYEKSSPDEDGPTGEQETQTHRKRPAKRTHHQKKVMQSREAERIKQLQVRAATGDSAAQFELGSRYLNGLGVPKDYGVALGWLRRAAAANNADAQFTLASMYDEGRGVAQDYRLAASWNIKAAEQGHAGAQHNLGMLYLSGDGITPDILKAHMWLNLAASQGNAAALHARNKTEARMSRWQLDEAQAMARAWQARHQ